MNTKWAVTPTSALNSATYVPDVPDVPGVPGFRNFTCIAGLSALLALAGCNQYDGIPMIGVDSQGNPVQVFVPEKEYSERVVAVASSVNDSALPALNRQKTRPGWMVRTLTIGINASAQIGIGPFQIGAVPRFRFIFSNSTDPTLP